MRVQKPRLTVGLAAATLVLAACTSSSDAGDAASGRDTPDPTPTGTTGSGAELVPETGNVELPAGRHALRITPSLTYEVDLSGPRFVSDGIYLHHPDVGGIFVVAAAPADTTTLPRHPCSDLSGTTVGPTPEDLATALAEQPVIRVRDTGPVTLDGAEGVSLTVRTPRGYDAADCARPGELVLFSTGDEDWTWLPEYDGRWWILDVDGQRVVILNHCDRACSRDEIAQLRAMTESVTFTSGS